MGWKLLPKDTKALVSIARCLEYRSRLVKDVIAVNAMQARRMVEIAEEELGDLRRKNVAVLGLSFKPDTDDLREAPSLRIIELLLGKGAKVIAFDPVATENARRVLGNRIEYAKGISECLKNADCCMLVTEWGIFKKLRPEDFTAPMRRPLLIDGRRIFDPIVFSKKLELRAIGLNKCVGENLIGKAIIPAAGLGTRLLPATKEQPKEMLPILVSNDEGKLFLKPFLQVVFEQLYAAGIKEICFIVGRRKEALKITLR